MGKTEIIRNKQGIFSPLLIGEYERLRKEALVALYSVPGDPRKAPDDMNVPQYAKIREELGELEAVRQSMLNPYDIHATCEVPGRLALVRKMTPHGMNEMTVMAQEGYDNQPIDNLFGFGSEIRQSFHRVGCAFSTYSEGKGLYPIISFTYDPKTKDRKAAQSVKIFHLQLTARSLEELNQIRTQVKSLDNLNSDVESRQFIDESSVVISLILNDYFEAYPLTSLKPIAPFSIDGCSNIRFNVGKNWEDILNPSFDTNFAKIHNVMNSIYEQFAGATMSGDTGYWKRPEISLEKAGIYTDHLTWMKDETRQLFMHFLSQLRPTYLNNIERLKRLNLLSHIYPLANFCYGAAINRNKNGDLLLSIIPKIFSETGGTGLQYMDPVGGGVHVRVGRGRGLYTPDQLEQKINFEKDCTQSILEQLAIH